MAAKLPPDVVEAITDALADALVADYLDDLRKESTEPDPPDDADKDPRP